MCVCVCVCVCVSVASTGPQATAPTAAAATSSTAMNTVCTHDGIWRIAQLDFDWKRVGRRLIGDQCVRDIDREEHDEQDRRDRMLSTWLQQAGSRATYSCLVKVLVDVGNKLTAEMVTRLVIKGENGWG